MKKLVHKLCVNLLTLTLLIIILQDTVESKNQYVTPLNMGMKVSVPWDIANIFNRYPIQGALAALLAAGLAAILFFGVITSPFGYMFGVPSEKYVLGDLQTIYENGQDSESRVGIHMKSRIDDNFNSIDIPQENYFHPLIAAPRSFGSESENDELSGSSWWELLKEAFDLNILMDGDVDPEGDSSRAIKGLKDVIWAYLNKLYNSKYSPKFLESLFYFMPNSGSTVRSAGCDLLTVCYAHGSLKRLPMGLLKIYQVFSRKMSEVPKEFKEAMLIGMENVQKCSDTYSEFCKENPFTITLKSYLNFLPTCALGKDVPKRKQAMYM